MAGVGFTALLGWSTVKAFEQPGEPIALSAVEQPEAEQRVRPGVPWSTANLQPRPLPTTQRHAEVEAPVEQNIESQEAEESQNTAITQVSITEPAQNLRYDRAGQVIMVNGKPWTGEVYDGKPIRPVRTVRMLTTAYSPDERSCGKWADGITASGYSVWTNGMKLVAADRSIPFGTILTIPGYNGGRPVPVLDRGGAIKGNRLDLLYPTHEIALQWGAQRLDVVVWEYVEAD